MKHVEGIKCHKVKTEVVKISSCFCFTHSFVSGLQHQGIFRVSGSQVEVNDIKNSFERGENVS